MPSQSAVRREAQLVNQVVRWLQDQGVPCAVRGWPDRVRDAWPKDLTVEAMLAFGQDPNTTSWALDVMAVPVPEAVVPSIMAARHRILPQAAVLAEHAKRAVTVSVRFVGDGRARNDYYDHVLELVESALATGSDYWDDSGADPATQVLLSSSEFIGDPSGPLGPVRAHLMFATSATGDLLDQLRGTLAKPLGKKLTNQLKRAKNLGYPTLLTLDQLGHEGLAGGTNWLPSADAVATIVAEVCAAHQGVLDAAILATPAGEIMQVFGNRLSRA
jgi:hypothetical protein